jgi:hypothetical protein
VPIVTPTRRTFLHALAATVAVPFTVPRVLSAQSGPHPTPRPGITADKVMSKEALTDRQDVADIFDGIREIPQIADGIRCTCGCADLLGYRSLLSCYEVGTAMGLYCPICQGEGRLTVRLHKEGKTLDQIRIAIDAKYGG